MEILLFRAIIAIVRKARAKNASFRALPDCIDRSMLKPERKSPSMLTRVHNCSSAFSGSMWIRSSISWPDFVPTDLRRSTLGWLEMEAL